MHNKVTALIYIIMWGMVEMVICLVGAIAKTLGAAGRTVGTLSILPRGWGVATSCLSRRHSQPHGATTGHRYSRCDGRGIRPFS